MIKLIKEGIPKTHLIWEGTCWNCESVMHAEVGDLHRHMEGEETFYHTACLVCSSVVIFTRLQKKKKRPLSER